MTSFRFNTLLACAILAKIVVADESLYIPGFDSQELSASIAGVGDDGRTTYVIVQAPDATDGSFPATATLVEGANDAFVTMDISEEGISDQIGESCTFSDGIAVCTVIDAAFSTTMVESETISGFIVEGATAAGSSTPAAGSSNTIASKTASGSSVSVTGSSASASATEANTSGASRDVVSTLAALPVFAGVAFLVLAW